MVLRTVVIIGAGYFGISAANRLANSGKDISVKLISSSKFTYSLVSSIRVPVQNDPKRTVYPVDEVLNKQVELIIDEVTDINPGSVGLKEQGTLKFDSLIIATGAKWANPLGSTNQFKDDYVKYFEDQHNKIKNAKHIVLVGGGFNNIELIGELMYKYKDELSKKQKKITMVHSSKLLLPDNEIYGQAMKERVTNFLNDHKDVEIILQSRANVLEDGRTVEIISGDDKKTLEADLVITHTGVLPSVPPNELDNFTNDRGFIKVKDTFQATSYSNIFAIGDVTDFLYKGLFYRGAWLDALTKNVISVLESPQGIPSKLATITRPSGNLPTVVSIGPEYGFGQIKLWFLGTCRIPSWYCVMVKSKDLFRGQAKHLFKS